MICAARSTEAAYIQAARNRQDARTLEQQSRCVTIAGCGHRARSADLRGSGHWAAGHRPRADQVYLYLLPASGQARPDQRRFPSLGRTRSRRLLSPDSSQVACREEYGTQKA